MKLYYNISLKCNERCSKCHHWKSNSSNDYIDTIKIAQLIAKLKITSMSISGGEPLLFKKELLNLIKVIPDAEIHIVTNGVLLDREFLNKIKPYKIYIILSIDTINKTKWKFVRGNDTYSIVMKNLDACVEVLGVDRMCVQSVRAIETLSDIQAVKEFCDIRSIHFSIQDYVQNGFDGEWHPCKDGFNQSNKSQLKCMAYCNNIVLQNDGTIWGCFFQPYISGCHQCLADLRRDDWWLQLHSEYSAGVRRKMRACDLECKQLRCNK